MNNLYTKHVPVVRDTTRSPINHMPLIGRATPFYVTLTIPTFTVPSYTWPTPSIIVTEFRYTTTEPFSILLPIVPIASPKFCLAIRWEVGDEVVRYKLWNGVGETLYYPVYNSQCIPAGEFVIEVWTVATSTDVTLATPYTLSTTLISSTAGTDDASLVCSCSRGSGDNINLTEYCGIFTRMFDRAVFPFTFDTCLSVIEAIKPGYKFILTWGPLPVDLDMHMKASIGGVSYHIYYPEIARGDLNVYPYIALDRDDTDGYGPESLLIGLVTNPGDYLLYIHKYEDGGGVAGDLTTSGAQIEIYNEKNTLLDTIDVPVVGAGKFWNVLTINDNVITVNNTIEAVEPTL